MMPAPASLCALLCLGLVVGCDGPANDGKAPSVGKAAAKKEGEAKKPGDSKKPADTKTPPTDTTGDDGHGELSLKMDEAKRAKFKKNAAELRTLVGKAREKSKAGDFAAATELYKKAVKLDDDNAHILGELGWAQVNAKDLDGAERNIRLALRYEDDIRRRADMLYALGLIEEERGDFAKAKEHYDHSLELQERKDAREHDQAVGKKAAAACAGGKCTKPDYPDLAKACEAMLARAHEQQGLKPHTADDEFSCDPDKAKKVTLTGGDATEAVILVVKGEHAGTAEEEHDLLAHIDGGWHWVGTVLDIENPHHGGIDRTGELKSLEARELMPDTPGQEIVVHVALEEADVDFEDNMIYHDEHEAYVVCGITKGEHVCYEIPTFLYFEADALDPDGPTPHDLSTHEFKAKPEFDGKGNVTINGEGEVPKLLEGTKKISELPQPRGFVFLHDD